MNKKVLQAKQLEYHYGLKGVNLTIHSHEKIALIGINGAGKSTLLKILAGILEPDRGEVYLHDTALKKMKRRQFVKKIAWLSQMDNPSPDFLVEDYIALGRMPFRYPPNALQDKEALQFAIERCQISGLLGRKLGELSGGERQRVFLARCLVQTPDILLLDEPTNHMDLKTKIEIVSVLKDLPITVVCIVHDFHLISHFFERVILLDKGRIIKDGIIKDVLFSNEFQNVFRLKTHIVKVDDGTEEFIFRSYVS
ncbi:ABC transporter ATP-binding protein [Swingsia samuiensis]|uniref:ABC transporter ATP-binding protein n=1 Tax=Swingsia samuiensis TaxID=1293412 RepID=A0A4Y6UNY3_9PROT|nr:ABC transporter ATP-binding protein [Swingsia samuiensis]QDH17765.1 ABC transporter ATP-binding protein [Swingsia samuiensis]